MTFGGQFRLGRVKGDEQDVTGGKGNGWIEISAR